jgi:nicotinate-nucleotide pyrophosphorylase (carboxylating)
VTALHAATAKALAEADLDPAYVEQVARATVEEDLAGGVDVTSVATVPGCRSRWRCSTWSATSR